MAKLKKREEDIKHSLNGLLKKGAVAFVIFQEYLYILCEFVEHSFETIGSKGCRLSSKMYKYSRF